jgi:hypothetical protein
MSRRLEETMSRRRKRVKKKIALIEKRIQVNKDEMRDTMSVLFTHLSEATIATVSRFPGRTINDATALTAYGHLRDMINQGRDLAVDTESYQSGTSDVDCLVQMIRAAWTAPVTKVKPDSEILLSIIADLEATV